MKTVKETLTFPKMTSSIAQALLKPTLQNLNLNLDEDRRFVTLHTINKVVIIITIIIIIPTGSTLAGDWRWTYDVFRSLKVWRPVLAV